MRGFQWQLLVLPLLVLSGCGSRLAPVPAVFLKPQPTEIKLHQVGTELWLGWRGASSNKLVAWRLRLEYLKRGCVSCQADAKHKWQILEESFQLAGADVGADAGADVGDLAGDQGIREYRFEKGWRYVLLGKADGAVRAGVSAKVLGSGFGPEKISKLFLGVVTLPVWSLSSEELSVGVTRLFWRPLATGLKANLYGRVAGDDGWSLIPLNVQPLEATQWIWFAVADEGSSVREFALRVVDVWGNEGALSPVVRLPSTR